VIYRREIYMKKSNYYTILKRIIVLFILIFYLLIDNGIVYAETLDSSENGFHGWYISIEDIYTLREKYEKNPDLEKEKARGFLIDRAKNYKKDMDYMNTGNGYGNVFIYKEDVGYINYSISNVNIISSYFGPGPIYLYSAVTHDCIDLGTSKEELERFIEYNNKAAEEYRAVCEYVRNHLQEDEYSGVYFENNIPYVGLSDKSKAVILEQEGIAWEFSEFYEKSREDMHYQLRYLWENREELKIVEVMARCNQVIIYGLDSEEKFYEKVQGKNLEDCHYEKAFKTWGIDERLIKIEEWHKLSQLSNFILIKRNNQLYMDWGENFWKELEPWLEYMKQLYPGYSYENLFSLAYVSRDKNYYTDFDSELEEFAEGLSYTENQKNPFDENEFGDPEHLVLQALLKKYKELEPEEEYTQLYDTYVKKINENSLYTAEEKRNRLIWKLLQAEKELEKLQIPEKNSRLLAAAGFGGLIVSCGVFALIKMKKEGIN